MVYAVKDAPVADVEEHAVLTVMADESDEGGCGVLLATSTIAKRARVSEKTAQRRIDDMLARKLLGLGDQSKAAYIRRDRRPVVYDILIPYSAYSPRAVARVNEARAAKSLPPLTPENRPDIDPPPPTKRRADLGTKRAKTGGVTGSPPAESDEVTASPPVDGVTTSPGGLANTDGVTTNPPRGVYKSPDPSFDPVVDPPPPSAAEPRAAAPVPVVVESEPAQEQPAVEVLDRVLAAARVPGQCQPGSTGRARVLPLLAARLAGGWEPAALVAALGDPLDTAANVPGALLWRIGALGTPPPPRPARRKPAERVPAVVDDGLEARLLAARLDRDTARALARTAAGGQPSARQAAAG